MMENSISILLKRLYNDRMIHEMNGLCARKTKKNREVYLHVSDFAG